MYWSYYFCAYADIYIIAYDRSFLVKETFVADTIISMKLAIFTYSGISIDYNRSIMIYL